MSYVRHIAGGALLVLLATTPLAAQYRGIVISGRGGGYSSTSNINDAGTADFDLGFTLGGGVAWRLGRNIALRSDFTWARSLDGPGISGLGGTEINRYYYGGDVQLLLPIASFTPYVFGGAGGVTLDQSGTGSLTRLTRVAGRFGVGFSYEIPRTRFSLFSQGTGWVYNFDNRLFQERESRIGVDGRQFDIAWTGGISYRLRLPF